MYAHRKDKEARYGIDEDALFGKAEDRLLAATTWEQYDAAIYGALAAFHDSHLTYHPPPTAAPARGYTSFRLGLTTVLAHGPPARRDERAPRRRARRRGDRDRRHAGRRRAARGRRGPCGVAARGGEGRVREDVDERPVPKGDPPRARRIRTRDRAGTEHDIAIAPHESRASTRSSGSSNAATSRSWRSLALGWQGPREGDRRDAREGTRGEGDRDRPARRSRRHRRRRLSHRRRPRGGQGLTWHRMPFPSPD